MINGFNRMKILVIVRFMNGALFSIPQRIIS